MKKILLILLLCPFFVEAIGGNGTTTSVSTTGAVSGCNGYVWYLGGNAIPPEGVRVTFYSLSGQQIGDTIDVFNQKYIYSSDTHLDVHTTCSLNGRFYKCKGSTHVNFINGMPSKVDYIDKCNSSGCSEFAAGQKFQPASGGYVYYVDDNFDQRLDYNPLTYTKNDPNQNAIFRNYFTSPAIVKKYMKLAGITNIDPYTSSDYLFSLEPVVPVSACVTGSMGASVLSTADIAYWFSRNGITLSSTLNCSLSRSLRLVESGKYATIGSYQFEVPTFKNCSDELYSWKERTIKKYGVGMYLIYGEQVSGMSSRAAVVYHTISLSQPFLDIDGNVRTLDPASNWYNNESTIDANIYKKNPIYTVVLTPKTIKKIREDNKNIKYSELSSATFATFKSTYASIFR